VPGKEQRSFQERVIYFGMLVGWNLFCVATLRAMAGADAAVLSRASIVGPILISGILTGLMFRPLLRDPKRKGTPALAGGFLIASTFFVTFLISTWNAGAAVLKGGYDADNSMNVISRIPTPTMLTLIIAAIAAGIASVQALSLADRWARDLAKKVNHA